MAIAISEEHRELARTARSFLRDQDARAANRALLEADEEELPGFWREFAGLGLARPARSRGARRLRVRAAGAGRRGGGARPGRRARPVRADDGRVRGDRGGRRRRPAGAAPARPGRRRPRPRLGVDGSVTVQDGAASGDRRRRARRRARPGSSSCPPATTWSSSARARRASPSRRPATSTRPAASARVTLDGAAVDGVLAGRRTQRSSTSPARCPRAEAVGVARECTERRPSTPRTAQQFGRADRHVPGGQAPLRQHARRHRAGDRGGVGRRPRRRPRRRPVRATPRRSAATLAGPGRRPVRQPQHPGARRHRLHVGARRPPLPAPGHGAARRCSTPTTRPRDVTDLTRRGRRPRASRRPAARGRGRSATRCARSPTRINGLDADEQRDAADRDRLRRCRTGRKPWGRDAGAIEQLVIEQEFARRRRQRARSYGITGWVILTLIQHATDDQVDALGAARAAPGGDLVPAVQRARRRAPTPPASRPRRRGSTAAGSSTARRCGRAAPTSPAAGFATVRTNPDVAEARRHHDDGHRHARRGRRGPAAADDHRATRSSTRCSSTTCSSPTTTSSGPVDGGWTVARATLGNESVSIGGGSGGMSAARHVLIAPVRRPPRARSPAAAERIGRYIAASSRRCGCSTCAAPTAPSPAASPGPRATSPSSCCPSSATTPRPILLAALDGPGRRLHRRRRRDAASMLVLMHRGHVDRRRHVGDQAQPDRRAHPRPPPRPADQLTEPASETAPASGGAVLVSGAGFSRRGRPLSAILTIP